MTALRSRRAMSKRTATLWKAPPVRERRGDGASLPVTGEDHRERRDAEAPAPSSMPEFLRAFPSVGSSTPDREQRHGLRRRPRRDASSRRGSTPSVVIAPTYPTARPEEREKERSRESRTKFRRHATSRRSDTFSVILLHLYVRKRDLVVSFS